MPDDHDLIAALDEIRRRGAIGEADLRQAVEHSRRFVTLLPAAVDDLVDLGSGGGLPGLVIAFDRPLLHIRLVERRAARADLLRRAARSLELGDRVEVHNTDVRQFAAGSPNSFDAVTARSFGAPEITARWAAALLVSGGVALVSEPPEPARTRWRPEVLSHYGLIDEGVDLGIRLLRRR